MLDACVAAAYAEALLMSMDPAEAKDLAARDRSLADVGADRPVRM